MQGPGDGRISRLEQRFWHERVNKDESDIEVVVLARRIGRR